ncbi:MAG TPA: SymE family type I addiction module toxin [Verrucomicrobiota bacterium]|nr:SymE family type I addiction module toxin [Verrucomicrobiota bacterium]
MKTPTRTLTIEVFNPKLRKTSQASLIRLKGHWLKQAGFHSGARVNVNNPSPGIIELRVCSPVEIDASYFTAMKQLDAVLK